MHFFYHLPIHPYVGGWPWIDAVDEDFAFVGADLHTVTAAGFSNMSVSYLSYSSMRPTRSSISSANRKFQSGCPPTDSEDSEVSTSECSSELR